MGLKMCLCFIGYAVLGMVAASVAMLLTMPSGGSGYGIFLIPSGALPVALCFALFGLLAGYLIQQKKGQTVTTVTIFMLVATSFCGPLLWRAVASTIK